MTPLSQLPLLVVPGIQGHWEWMRPALAALRQTSGLAGYTPTHDGTVLTFSLNEENGTGDPFAQWDARIDALIDQFDQSGAGRVVLVGVSFGGLVAARYAAHHPDRVGALILVSSPSPRKALGTAEQQSLRHPIATLPLFAWRGARRLLPEVLAARPSWGSRLSFLSSYLWQVLRRPIAPARMARWVRAWQSMDIGRDCALITVPTHLIMGERHLDRVVPVDSTLDYQALIPGSSVATLRETGHIGLVSRPDAFSILIHEFVHAVDDSRSRRSA
ncbi:MAG: alpha/beta hydrolase [Acidobacteria bacterium]|jgi:pimeloyl-ACP methyl ester carboxylesterase|nr:alpha/beta hydrolase [Acidobacteriota bacterium]